LSQRKIIHIDMDAFYASVEQRDNPALQGKPVAVGGSAMRGVVAAASYEARKYGVRSAMPSITAKRLCPDLIFVKHRFDVYREVSYQIREIFAEYTDLIEPLSLDEAFLDVTEVREEKFKHLIDHSGVPSATMIAEEIRKKIFEKTNLTASAGVSFNKFLAKVASDINKPNGIKVITPPEAILFLEDLPIEKFFGVGKVTAKRMHTLRIFTGKDLKQKSELELVQRFGKAGRHYYRIVRAEDHRKVNPNRIRKSIGAERTFSDDLITEKGMLEKLIPIAEKVFDYMKKANNFGRTITLKAKTPEFQSITRSKTFTSEPKDRKLFLSIVSDLLKNHIHEFQEVRLLGVQVSNLEKDQTMVGGIQLEFDFWDLENDEEE
jgi:DNA polymerase-4